jgi:integrase/recombinase XerD
MTGQQCPLWGPSNSLICQSPTAARVPGPVRKRLSAPLLPEPQGIRTTAKGTQPSPATLQTYVAAIKSLLGFAHKVGFTRFNAAPLIKLKKAPRKLAEKLIGEVEVQLIIRSARPGRDQAMLRVMYYGGLRVAELASLTWSSVIPRDSGEVQLALVGKGDKARNVLLPAEVGHDLLALRHGALSGARCFPITERRVSYIVKAAARRAGIDREVSPHTFRHAHASHALDNGASIALVSATLGHADLKTTSVYAHAKPGDSSSRFLK